MEENKVLFSVIKGNDSCSVKMHTENTEDVFTVALGIRQAIVECPNLLSMILSIMVLEKDEEFKQKLKDSTIDMPDFDEILKNIK